MTTANWPCPPDCFFTLALGLAGRKDRLAVLDTHLLGRDVHAELALEAGEGDGDVDVADTAQHGLVRLVVESDDEGGIFDNEALQGARQLVVVGLRHRHERHSVPGGGRLDTLDTHRLALGGERAAGRRRGELRYGTDVAGHEAAGIDVLATAQVEQAVHTLVGAGRRLARWCRCGACRTPP